jgi:hypothetical protein
MSRSAYVTYVTRIKTKKKSTNKVENSGALGLPFV